MDEEVLETRKIIWEQRKVPTMEDPEIDRFCQNWTLTVNKNPGDRDSSATTRSSTPTSNSVGKISAYPNEIIEGDVYALRCLLKFRLKTVPAGLGQPRLTIRHLQMCTEAGYMRSGVGSESSMSGGSQLIPLFG